MTKPYENPTAREILERIEALERRLVAVEEVVTAALGEATQSLTGDTEATDGGGE